MTIFKYPLEITNAQDIAVPIGAKFIAVQMQGDVLCAWAIVNSDNKTTERRIRIVGTGHPFSGRNWEYIGTVQTNGGRLVWHVFDDGDVR